MFVERLIYKHVKERLDWYLSRPKRFEDFLIDIGGIDEAEALEARAALEESPPTAVHGYARQGGPFPCFALVLGNENIASDYIGEDGFPFDEDGDAYMDSAGDLVDMHVRRWEHRLDWYVYVAHPDLCLYYYNLLRHIMVGLRTRLQAEDLDEITYSGAELAPDPRYMPSDMFTRRFSITCRADEPYVEDYKPGMGPGVEITGLTVEDDGNVVPYQE